MLRVFFCAIVFALSSVSIYASPQKSPYALWDEAYSLYRAADTSGVVGAAEVASQAYRMAVGYELEGMMKYRRQDYRGAADAFEKALAIDGTLTFVYKYLAIAYMRAGDPRLAHARIQKYRALMPKDSEAEKIQNAAHKALGTDFFRGERNKKRARYEAKSAQAVTFADSPLSVSVCVAQGVKRFVLKTTGVFAVYAKGEQLMRGEPGKVYDVLGFRGGIAVYDNGEKIAEASYPCELVGARSTLFGLFNIAHGKGDFWAGIIDSFFRGRIRILHESGMMSLVNIVGLEEYLYGVLPSEMYPDFPKEALKAQAVIARTLALKRKGQFKKKGYDFLNSTSTQVYLGVSQEKPASTAAVDATRGIVLSLPDGGIPEMFFASNSGGYTVDKGFGLSYYRGARDVKIMSSLTFPLDSRELVGYLSPAFDCFSRPKDADKFSAYRWQRFYTQNEAKMLVNAAGFKCDAVFGIDVVRRNVSGHAEEVSVDTDRGEYVIEGEGRIRDALGKLRSSLFFAQKMQTGDDLPDFMIWGGGFGHGIGLCQFGARGMAEAGRTWKEVLAHYYPALELKKAY